MLAHSADALTVNITPSNANNKIFLTAHVSMGLNNDNEVNWVFYKAGSLLTGYMLELLTVIVNQEQLLAM